MIYMDNAATTYPKPEAVYRALDEANRTLAVNAGRGSYRLAREAEACIARTRDKIREIAGAGASAEVVLTASATLACNQILNGLSWRREDVVYVSPYEHNAVVRVLHLLQKRYEFRIEELKMDAQGELDMMAIAFQFRQLPPSVLIMTHVSNVTGQILPVFAVAALPEAACAVKIVDGSQAFGLIPLNLQREAIDFYVFAGHKTPYGPFGAGGFLNMGGRSLLPFLAGGTGSDSLNPEMPERAPGRLEPGSPNIVAIAGLEAALAQLGGEYRSGGRLRKEQEMISYLRERLGNIPGVRLYLPPSRGNIGQTGILAFNIDGYHAEDTAMILDQDYDIAVRAGYHCAPLIHKYIAMPGDVGVVRASIGQFTTYEELDRLAEAVREIAEG